MKNCFENKNVLITGHTGFKGSWLASWLNLLGAKVSGISLEPSSFPSHYELLSLRTKIESLILDIRDYKVLSSKLKKIKPDYIFHLAAQPIVKYSYQNPLETFNTNVMGTINLLESLKSFKHECTVILITSDKCYENVEWIWGYKETDKLGGSDPYSASKAAAEISIKSYIDSFFPKDENIKISIGRAGNVIGGGDWSDSRIIPDAMKSWSNNKSLELKNPNSTRPWQHVLEPLSGYITLAQKLSQNKELHGEAFNFGPKSDQNFTVHKVIEEISKYWKGSEWSCNKNSKNKFHEAGLLKLNCDKAQHMLGWTSSLEFHETIKYTAEWYASYYNNLNVSEVTEKQIHDYSKLI